MASRNQKTEPSSTVPTTEKTGTPNPQKDSDYSRTIESNVAAALQAYAALKLLADEHVNHPRYWERLIELCQEHIPPKKEYEIADPMKPKPMNDIAAKSFEKTKVPFGKYKDAYVGQCKFDYLEWLASEDDFIGQLRRYVLSKRFQERKRNEC